MIDRRITELCQAGMMQPFNKECVQPCSYDVHLGENALLETESGFQSICLAKYTKADPFWLYPNEFLLGETQEYVSLPHNVEAHLHLVSSRAREGLNHSLAGLVDCGWRGVLTLEVKNILQYGRIGLYPGQRIAQLTFFEYSEYAQKGYKGRYSGDDKVSAYKRQSSSN